MMKIDPTAMACIVEVDNRIALHYYYRIADNPLKQASIYRDEKNFVDLYIILLRYSSLVSETILFHRDYQGLLTVLDEFESLKPELHRRIEELNKAQPGNLALQSTWKYSNDHNLIDKQFQKLSLNIPLPNRETLSRHSFFGPNGLRGQWLGPSVEIKPNTRIKITGITGYQDYPAVTLDS